MGAGSRKDEERARRTEDRQLTKAPRWKGRGGMAGGPGARGGRSARKEMTGLPSWLEGTEDTVTSGTPVTPTEKGFMTVTIPLFFFQSKSAADLGAPSGQQGHPRNRGPQHRPSECLRARDRGPHR